MKNLKMKDKLLAQSLAAKNKKERNIQVKSKEKDALLSKRRTNGYREINEEEDDDDSHVQYQRLKSMYDRVQGNKCRGLWRKEVSILIIVISPSPLVLLLYSFIIF